jgi:uncharacterized membrane protein (UPF0127 family)
MTRDEERVDELIGEDDIGERQALAAAQREEARVARPGTDEIHHGRNLTCGKRIRVKLLLVTLMIGLGGCGHSVAKTPQKGEPSVVLTIKPGLEHKVLVELARTATERNRGLMYRQSLQQGRGMLFLFEHPEPLKFWMKNTYIPLDMIFMDEQKRVVYVEENAEPLTLNERGPDGVDTQYVLEVPGGWAQAHDVRSGVVVKFLNVD